LVVTFFNLVLLFGFLIASRRADRPELVGIFREGGGGGGADGIVINKWILFDSMIQ